MPQRFSAYVPASEISQDDFPDTSEYVPGVHMTHASPFGDDVVGGQISHPDRSAFGS